MKTFHTFKQKLDLPPINEDVTPDDELKDEKSFRARLKAFLRKHRVTVKGDPYGNKDDVYKGAVKKRGGKRPADQENNKMDNIHFDHMKESLSPSEKRKKEEIVKSMKKDKDSLMKRYGDDWKDVMYATATKKAKVAVEQVDEARDPYDLSAAKNSGLKAMLRMARKNNNKKSVEAIEAELRRRDIDPSSISESLNEGHDDVVQVYVDKLPGLADEIEMIVDELVESHNEFLTTRDLADANDGPVPMPAVNQYMHNSKEVARVLEDCRDFLKAIQVKRMAEDLEANYEEIISEVSQGTKDRYIKEAKISTTRYVNTWGKEPPKLNAGLWMFTDKERGKVDMSDKKSVFQAQGKFKDAAKAAKEWAKKEGHSYLYVMEDVQPLEESKFSTGKLKLDDGKTINITSKDAEVLNDFYEQLSTSNKKQMEETMKQDTKSYREVLQFAKENV